MGLCLKYITFDPNYNYDNEEEEEEDMMETENGEDEEQGAYLWGWLCSAEYWVNVSTLPAFSLSVTLLSRSASIFSVLLNGLF